MRDFRSLAVWQRAHALTLAIYHASSAFPDEERYGLTSQIRHAASSIPANIAEGYGRGSDADFLRFLHIAGGFANELEYHLLLAHDLGFLDAQIHEELDREINEIKRMLHGLIRTLKTANG